jgi:hypothetical protein
MREDRGARAPRALVAGACATHTRRAAQHPSFGRSAVREFLNSFLNSPMG